MLSHAKLPNQFWAESLMTAIYVLNLSSCVPLGGDIPQRVWSGKKVSYKHLRVFGCRAFVHVPRDERSKLDSKTKQCVLLGHPDEQFGYRLWDPINKKIVRSRDVVFFEDETIEDIVKPKKPTTTPQVVDMDQIHSPVVHDNHGGDDGTKGAGSSQGDDQSSEDADADEDADVDDTPEEPQ